MTKAEFDTVMARFKVQQPAVPVPVVTLEQFEAMVKAHDKFYMYSDDDRVYQKGKAEYEQIIAVGRQFTELQTAEIYGRYWK